MKPFFRMGALGVALAGASPAVLADEFDTVNFNAGYTLLTDDNVFRLSGAADPNRLIGSPSKSDTIQVMSAGVRINKPYSLQRFELGLNLVDYKYDRFNFLSFTARNYDAAWRWSLTPKLTGNATTSRTQTLTSFTDFTGFVRNLRTSENSRFDATYQLDGVWRLLGAVSESKSSNSQVFIADFDVRQETIEAGIRYAFPSGSSWQLVARSGKGDFFKRPAPIAASLLDTKFDQSEYEGRLNWLVTGKTSVAARLAWLERTHANFSQRDYSGWVGNFDLNWGITGKTRLSTGYARELANFVQASSSYIVTNRVFAGPSWEITSKAVARARYDYSTRDFLGPVAATPLNDRVDTIKSMSVGVDWQPTRNFTFSASLQNDKRSSNLPGLDFKSTTATLAAQMTF
jgi:exopolysaccharide biosynthesis operon protein EpsL